MTSEIPFRSFSAGDLVLSCDPWVWALASRDEYSRYCAFCFMERQDLRTCSKCKLHRYCDAKCQMADWKQEHKEECIFLGGVDTNASHCAVGRGLMPVILMSKIARKLVNNIRDNLAGVGTKTAREIVDSLPCYPANENRPSFFNFTPLEKIYPEKLFPTFNPFSSQLDFVHFVRIIEYSVFPVVDPGLLAIAKHSVIGAAVIPQAPFRAMTPVCRDSNVVLEFRGRKFVIHATEDIAQYTGLIDLRFSELVCDPFLLTSPERRRLFEQIYHRPCGCRKCTPAYEAEIDPLKCVTPGCAERIPSDERALLPCPQCGAIGQPEKLQQLKRFVNKLEKIRKRWRLNEAHVQQYHAAETALRQEIDLTGILHADAHIRFLVGWHGIRTYGNQGRLVEDWELCKGLVGCVREIIPRYHPRRADFLLQAADCVGRFLCRLRDMERDAVTKQAALQLLTDLFDNSALGFDFCKEAWEIYRRIYGVCSKQAIYVMQCYAFIEDGKQEISGPELCQIAEMLSCQ